MARLVFLLISSLLLYGSHASAQGLQVEAQGSVGYVRDSGEGPSVPALNVAAIVWLTSRVGIGGHVVRGIGNDHFDPPIVNDDRTFLGPGGLRMWAAMFHLRGEQRRVEFNLGVGLGGHSYEDHDVLTGIRRADETIDPITPELHRLRYATGFIASEMLIGIRLVGPVHLKGGFTYGLADDVHPFQPMMLLSIKSRGN